MCIIHLLWCMLIEIAFTRSVGGPHIRHHSLFMNKHITVAFTHQAGRQAVSQANRSPFLCHAEFAHNSGFYLLWSNLTQAFTQNTGFSFYHLSMAMAVAVAVEAGASQKKSMTFAYILCIALKCYLLSLDVCVRAYAHLGAFYCSTLQIQSIHTYVYVRGPGCYASTKIKSFLESFAQRSPMTVQTIIVDFLAVLELHAG